MKKLIHLFGIVSVIALATAAQGQEMKMKPAAARWNDKGELLQPENYREWIFVGAPLTPNDMNNGKAAFPEFHNVYIDPASWAAYKKTGEFPDGTVIVKELVSVGSKVATSGNGYFQGEFLGVEALVKSVTKHSDQPGHWGFYSFSQAGKEPKKSTIIMAVASCSACHQAGAKQDFVFTQYYPVLRAAKK